MIGPSPPSRVPVQGALGPEEAAHRQRFYSTCTQQALRKRAGNLELEMASFLGGRFWGAGSRSWVEDTPPRLTHNLWLLLYSRG